MKLLDTTFLIHYWGGTEDVAAYLESTENSDFITTTLNIKEIAVGRELQGELSRPELQSTFDWVEIVPFTREHAFHAAVLEATLHRDESITKDKINALTADLLIAAVAKERNAPVVTQNIADFEHFAGVSTESY